MQLNDLTTCGGLFTDEEGKPLAGGLLACYLPGSSIFKALYAEDGTLVSNPAGIGSDGSLETHAYLGDGVSELKLYAPNFPGAVYDPNDFPGTDWRLVRSWRVRGSGGAQALPSVGSIAGLRLLDCSQMASGAVVAVSGYYAQGDSPSRLFTLKDGAATDNGGTIIAALGGGRYWEWEPEGDIDVRTFGAIPDGDRDNRPMLVAAATAASSRYAGIVIPAGVYKVSEGTVSCYGLRLRAGASFQNDTAGTLFSLKPYEWIDIGLTSGANNAASLGKVLLDFTTYVGSDPVRSLWNDGWAPGEVGPGGGCDVNWAPASGTLVVSGPVNLAQDVARIEVEQGAYPGIPIDAYDVATTSPRSVTIGELVSAGGYASLQWGNFTIGKTYTSAFDPGRNGAVTADVLVDADWAISTASQGGGSWRKGYSGLTLYGVPGGGLVSVTTVSDSADVTLVGVVSEAPIFGTLAFYAGGKLIASDPLKQPKAKHFATIGDEAVRIVAAANGGVADLEGKTYVSGATPGVVTVENGAVSFEDNLTITTGEPTYRNCRLSFGSGVSFGQGALGVWTKPTMISCEVSGTFSAQYLTATDCVFDTQLVLSGDMGDTLLLRNSFTGEGAALDVSGLTSWAGKCRIAENNPIYFGNAPSPTVGYWPQTEGELRSGATTASCDFTESTYPPMIAAASSVRATFGNCTTKATYCEPITGGVRVNTADGTAAGTGAVWYLRFNFTKLS